MGCVLNLSKMASWRVNLKLHFKKGKACGLAKKNELCILDPCVVTWLGGKKRMHKERDSKESILPTFAYKQ